MSVTEIPTPRTDGQFVFFARTSAGYVPIEFARQLERELAEAKDSLQTAERRLKEWQHASERNRDEMVTFKMKCDNLHAENEKLEKHLGAAEDWIRMAKISMDGGRAQNDRLREALISYREALSDGPENCSWITYDLVDEKAKEALKEDGK